MSYGTNGGLSCETMIKEKVLEELQERAKEGKSRTAS